MENRNWSNAEQEKKKTELKRKQMEIDRVDTQCTSQSPRLLDVLPNNPYPTKMLCLVANTSCLSMKPCCLRSYSWKETARIVETALRFSPLGYKHIKHKSKSNTDRGRMCTKNKHMEFSYFSASMCRIKEPRELQPILTFRPRKTKYLQIA